MYWLKRFLEGTPAYRLYAEHLIRDHEGIGPYGFNKVYLDSEGIPTAGVGLNIHELNRQGYSLPLVPGAEIDTRFLEERFREAVDTSERTAHKFAAPEIWKKLNWKRRAALIDMAFNLGETRLFNFKETRRKLQSAVLGDRGITFKDVALEAADSLWFRQTGRRGLKITGLLRG